MQSISNSYLSYSAQWLLSLLTKSNLLWIYKSQMTGDSNSDRSLLLHPLNVVLRISSGILSNYADTQFVTQGNQCKNSLLSTLSKRQFELNRLWSWVMACLGSNKQQMYHKWECLYLFTKWQYFNPLIAIILQEQSLIFSLVFDFKMNSNNFLIYRIHEKVNKWKSTFERI